MTAPGNTERQGDVPGRSLAGFTVELEVYSGPYEWLLALVLKEELEIFEVPLREIVGLYLASRPQDRADGPDALDRDTDFVGSAAALVLLKSRTLLPVPDEEDLGDEISAEDLAGRLETYIKVRGAAEALRERLVANVGHYPSAHPLRPRPGALTIRTDRIVGAARRAFSRIAEPPVEHLGTITVTVQELATLIQTTLASGPVDFERLTRNMDRLRSAVAFAAALSLAHEGRLRLLQNEPLGALTLSPAG